MLKYLVAAKLVFLRAETDADKLTLLDHVEAWKAWSAGLKASIGRGGSAGERGFELPERIFAEVCGVTGALELCETTLTYGPRRWGRGPARIGTLMCLGKAFMLLCRGRWLQALECARRGLQEKGVDALERLELHVLSSIALHHLAQSALAEAHIARAEVLCASGGLPPAMRALMSCLRRDMRAVRILRHSHVDHAYWMPDAGASGRSDSDPIPFGGFQEQDGVPAFINERLHALHWASDLSDNRETSSLSRVMNEVHKLRDAGCARAAQELCIDTAHAALIANRADWAELFVRLLGDTGTLTELGRIELEYVLSRCRGLQGRTDESYRCYQRYVRMAMEALGRQAAGHPAFVDHEHARTHHADAYEMRLPAKYRSIYRYIIANLSDPALSVGFLAARAGVTERALQATFKSYLGKTPSELIQNARLEQARTELQDASGRALSAAEVGRKWGISRRSKLLFALSTSEAVPVLRTQA